MILLRRGFAQHLSKLLPLYNFLLRNEFGQVIQNIPVSGQDPPHPLMGLLHHLGNFFIYLAGFLFSVGFTGSKTFRQEHRLTSALIGRCVAPCLVAATYWH